MGGEKIDEATVDAMIPPPKCSWKYQPRRTRSAEELSQFFKPEAVKRMMSNCKGKEMRGCCSVIAMVWRSWGNDLTTGWTRNASSVADINKYGKCILNKQMNAVKTTKQSQIKEIPQKALRKMLLEQPEIYIPIVQSLYPLKL